MEKKFGLFLSQKRKEAKLTQKALAEKLFVSESAVSKWEKNVAHPDITLLPKICEILKVTEHELITASVDLEHKETVKRAKKWKGLVTAWDMFFYIGYAVALLTCFVVDLATSGTLGWFWIVFSAVLLSASFTTLPKFIKKYKLLFVPLVELGLLLFMLLVIVLYTGGDWFFVVALPIFILYIMIFLPIYIHIYDFPKLLKQHNAIISLFIDYLFTLIMLAIINNYSNGNWFVGVGLPITTIGFAIVILLTTIMRYSKINRLQKTSLILLICSVISFTGNYVVDSVLYKFGISEKPSIILPNFSNWSSEVFIENNIICIITLVLLILSIIFLIVGSAKAKRK